MRIRLLGTAMLASAFAPLIVLLTLFRLRELGGSGWAVLGLCVVVIGLLGGVLRSTRSTQEHLVDAAEVSRADTKILEFTSTYIGPILVAVFGDSDWPTFATTIGLILLLAVIYVRGEMYHLNPTLALSGFRLYEVRENSGRTTMLLTRQRQLPTTGDITLRRLAGDVAIQLGKDHQ